MQSLRVVDKLEKDGRGLNLTWEVRNGIVTHTKGTWAATPEGRIVRMADQIAFVNHDIEDAVRAGVLDPATLPRECTAVLGETKSQRITTMINSILRSSEGDVQVGAEENEASWPSRTSCTAPSMWIAAPKRKNRRWKRCSPSCTSIT